MKKFTAKELENVLKSHYLWVEDSRNGVRANLIGVDLMGVDLRRADLRWADLMGANLREADLMGANLRRADLMRADLREADLIGASLIVANLREADLMGANLREADLMGVDLSKADLRGANLGDADLRGANLRGADLRGANLGDADLRGADLSEADLSEVKNLCIPIACPEKGSFTAFKKAYVCDDEESRFRIPCIVELQIPASAKRCSATSRKCRCSKAKVVSITHEDGTKCDIISAVSSYDENFIYTVGKTVEVKDFDPNRWNECSTGIHFFITREEAVNY